MPIPKPKEDEAPMEFVKRCMADEKMKEEYPDEKQRYAVCISQYEEE